MPDPGGAVRARDNAGRRWFRGETPTGGSKLLRQRMRRLRRLLEDASAASEVVVQLDDQKVLQEVGIYRYHHPLENAAAPATPPRRRVARQL